MAKNFKIISHPSLSIHYKSERSTLAQLEHSKRLGIYTSTGLEIVPLSEIKRCQAEGNYCRVYLQNGQSLLASKTLKLLTEVLPEKIFTRIHQSHLVQTSLIRKIQKNQLLLAGGTKLPISRSKKSKLEDKIKLSLICV